MYLKKEETLPGSQDWWEKCEEQQSQRRRQWGSASRPEQRFPYSLWRNWGVVGISLHPRRGLFSPMTVTGKRSPWLYLDRQAPWCFLPQCCWGGGVWEQLGGHLVKTTTKGNLKIHGILVSSWRMIKNLRDYTDYTMQKPPCCDVTKAGLLVWQRYPHQTGMVEHFFLVHVPSPPVQVPPWYPSLINKRQHMVGQEQPAYLDLFCNSHCGGMGWLGQTVWQLASPIYFTSAKTPCKCSLACQLPQVKDYKNKADPAQCETENLLPSNTAMIILPACVHTHYSTQSSLPKFSLRLKWNAFLMTLTKVAPKTEDNVDGYIIDFFF